MKQNSSIDEYIDSYPKNIQEKLKAIRKIIKEEAPQATEKLSYGMPYFGLNGRLLYFAAQKNHIGLYAMPSAIVVFADELKSYGTAKGTIRFPLDMPLPLSLIRKIVKFRIKENLEKKKAK